MRFIFNILLLMCLLLISKNSYPNLDSLHQLLKKPICSNQQNSSNCLDDSIAFNIYVKIGLYHLEQKIDKAIYYHKEALKIASNSKSLYLTSIALDHLGSDYHKKGNYSKSINYFKNALSAIDSLLKKMNGKKRMHLLVYKSTILGHMASTLRDQGYYDKALSLFFESLKLEEKYGAQSNQATTLGSIGLIYWDLKNYEKSKEYTTKALMIHKNLNNIEGLGNSYTNLGILSFEEGKYEEALAYYTKSLEISKKLRDIHNQGILLSNIALLYKYKGEYDKALAYYFQAIKVAEKIDSKSNLTFIYGNIGILYVELENYREGEKYITKSFNLATEIGSLDDIKNAHDYYTALYANTNRPAKAFEHYQLFIQLRDSLFNLENTKASITRDLQYNYDKKAFSDSVAFAKKNEIKEIQISKQKAEIKAKKQQQIALYSGLMLVIIFAGLMYNRFKITQKQKIIIEDQKAIVESSHHLLAEKNKEITDSIQYAKRIQSAILPHEKMIKSYLPETFIIYKPKDIVAGDFYWFEVIDDTIFLAAADCTGHGVPGAMVSVVCHNALNRSVKDYGLKKPGEILDKTREIIIAEFEKSNEDVKDGMDISLATLHLRSKKQNENEENSSLSDSFSSLSWSGANNPLWILRNNEIIEYKADKQPIGKFLEAKQFTTHKIDLQKGDEIYLFTDGFQDQFGGEKQKKYKASQMRELFLSLITKSMVEKKEIINNSFEKWRGNLEQVDDVCLICFKI